MNNKALKSSLTCAILQKNIQEFENKCFYCGKPVIKKTVEVDHFIPWSFMKDDQIWNFVLACPECNNKNGYNEIWTLGNVNGSFDKLFDGVLDPMEQAFYKVSA